MIDQERFVGLSFQVDANRINGRGALKNMNRLEAWRKSGVVLINMSSVAQDEAKSGGDPRRSRKAISYISTLTQTLNEQERMEVSEIERILSPRGVKTQQEQNDVEIVFNAKKYGAILVTNDGGSRRQPGGILGNRDALRHVGTTVMTDSEAVALVQEKIARRDRHLRQMAEFDGTSVPPWIGMD